MAQPNRLPSDSGAAIPLQPGEDGVDIAPDALPFTIEEAPDADTAALDADPAQSAPFLSRAYARGAVTVEDTEEIVECLQGPLTRYICGMVGNREEAEDLAQSTMLKAFTHLSQGATIHPRALSTWIYTIAKHTAQDALRHRRIITWLPLSAFTDDRGVGAGVSPEQGDTAISHDAGPSASDMIAEAEWVGYDGGRFEAQVALRDEVIAALQQLPSRSRDTLLLHEYVGLSCREIADLFHASEPAVKMRLVRARELFDAAWARVDHPDDDTSAAEMPETTDAGTGNIPWHRLGVDPLRDAIGHHACDWLKPPAPAQHRKR